ncbi:hypothetical protein P153DRAFT_382274 [Dothidotthia symphoricarpi CBS 119687]|uniref:Uncharacterized protein n=1 Tax=Dothidotthia symphoricarpi CBS 119687 TaxID=1392245 RepID=A0A6A6ANM8_9PLEO|nr:uncharacterized protein P153DRAFT_382274 [Dothidotthia symphoricarpi CBS 119687]KAF2132655.1 hypothetical protein P153DRAFT_382274 [Dothidotthia symphoricarpi CBS 119687]
MQDGNRTDSVDVWFPCFRHDKKQKVELSFWHYIIASQIIEISTSRLSSLHAYADTAHHNARHLQSVTKSVVGFFMTPHLTLSSLGPHRDNYCLNNAIVYRFTNTSSPLTLAQQRASGLNEALFGMELTVWTCRAETESVSRVPGAKLATEVGLRPETPGQHAKRA